MKGLGICVFCAICGPIFRRSAAGFLDHGKHGMHRMKGPAKPAEPSWKRIGFLCVFVFFVANQLDHFTPTSNDRAPHEKAYRPGARSAVQRSSVTSGLGVSSVASTRFGPKPMKPGAMR